MRLRMIPNIATRADEMMGGGASVVDGSTPFGLRMHSGLALFLLLLAGCIPWWVFAGPATALDGSRPVAAVSQPEKGQALAPAAAPPIDSLDDVTEYTKGCMDELAVDDTLKGFLKRTGGYNCRNYCTAGNASGQCTSAGPAAGANCAAPGTQSTCPAGEICIAKDCLQAGDCGAGGACKINGRCTKGSKAGKCANDESVDCAKPYTNEGCGGNACKEKTCVKDEDCGDGGTCSGIPTLLTTCETGVNGAGACAGAASCKTVFNSRNAPGTCDNPSWLTDKCYGQTYIQNFQSNDKKVEGVLLCRHKKAWHGEDDDFDDVAIILSNEESGKTCWFQREKIGDTSGVGIPYPGDGANAKNFWWSPKKTATVACVGCHDNGPFMNSPWIRRVRVVPSDGFRKYSNPGRAFAKWPVPTRIEVGDEGLDPRDNVVKSCTSCHYLSAALYAGAKSSGEIGSGANQGTWGRWASWVTGGWSIEETPVRNGFSSVTNACGQTWEKASWMPRSGYPVENPGPPIAQGDWVTKYGKHLKALKDCAAGVGRNMALRDLGIPVPLRFAVPKFCELAAVNPAGLTLTPTAGPPIASIKITLNGGRILSEQATLDPGYEWASGTFQAALYDNATLSWSSQGVTACSIVATLPDDLELGGVKTGTNWATGSGNISLGSLPHYGWYRFRIDCDGPNTRRNADDGVHADLRVHVADPQCTVPFAEVEDSSGIAPTTIQDLLPRGHP